MANILFLYEGRPHHETEKLLRSVGYDVIATDSVCYAADILGRIEVDLCLIYVTTTEAPVLDLVSAVRSDQNFDYLPILVSGSTEETYALQLARQMGADDLVVESRNFDEDLLYQVRRHIHGTAPILTIRPNQNPQSYTGF
jgi:DNA-binding response OmpR family regulator